MRSVDSFKKQLEFLTDIFVSPCVQQDETKVCVVVDQVRCPSFAVPVEMQQRWLPWWVPSDECDSFQRQNIHLLPDTSRQRVCVCVFVCCRSWIRSSVRTSAMPETASSLETTWLPGSSGKQHTKDTPERNQVMWSSTSQNTFLYHCTVLCVITLILVSSFQRPLFVLADRNVDMATPLHHTWTYQALIHDVLVSCY